MICAAVAASFILLKASDEKISRAERAFAFATRLEEEIRYARTPIGDAVGSFDGGSEIMERLMRDETASRYIEAICLGTPESAESNAELLKNHTEKEMVMIKEKEKRLRVAKAALPILSALLVLILIL